MRPKEKWKHSFDLLLSDDATEMKTDSYLVIDEVDGAEKIQNKLIFDQIIYFVLPTSCLLEFCLR